MWRLEKNTSYQQKNLPFFKEVLSQRGIDQEKGGLVRNSHE